MDIAADYQTTLILVNSIISVVWKSAAIIRHVSNFLRKLVPLIPLNKGGRGLWG
jgi:hypothetical protein